MNTLTDVESPITRLNILKALLSNSITDSEVIKLLEEEIEKMQAEVDAQNIDADTNIEDDASLDDLFDTNEPLDFGSGGDSGSSVDLFNTDIDTNTEPSSEITTETTDTLPSPADLNIGDVSDSTNPELG